MRAGRYDFSIYQGETFLETIVWKDSNGSAINLTNYTITSELKRKPNDQNPVASFTCTVTNAAAGTFTRSMSATVSAGLPVAPLNSNGVIDPLSLYNDIKAVNGSTVYYITNGIASVYPRIT